MNENVKKILLVVVIVVAFGFAIRSASRLMTGDQMIIENTIKMPPGHKSEKQLALERMKTSGQPAPEPFKERDLGGDLGGN
jgi:hypothetical protein